MLETVVRQSSALSGTSTLPPNFSGQAVSSETKWIKWIPAYSGSVIVSAFNGEPSESSIFNPNIALYHRQDMTNLNLLYNAVGNFGKCTLRLLNAYNITAGVPYMVCIDNLLMGVGQWEINQVAPLLTMPFPAFFLSGRVGSIVPGGGSPQNVQIYWRFKPGTSFGSPRWIVLAGQIKFSNMPAGQYTLQAQATAPGYNPSMIVDFVVNIT